MARSFRCLTCVAKWCWSIFGRPGVALAGSRCRRWSGCTARIDRKDFEILAVSTDAQGVAVTRPFQQENHLTFPILHDADFRVGLSYGARTLPMTFMVDRQGIVRQQIFGARDWEASEAHQLIQMLMKS